MPATLTTFVRAAALTLLAVLSPVLLFAQDPVPAGEGQTISGPYTVRNLTVFLIHQKGSVRNEKIMTLQEALRRKKAIVYETGTVGELEIRNLSRDHSIYIQAGDIVKGGQQDRVIPEDVIVPPRSGKIPIPSLCVEQGRWSGRGSEQATAFGSSDNQIASRALKLAAKHKGEQQEVWNEVAASQSKLQGVLAADVRSELSHSSLQLTYENDSLERSVETYMDGLEKIIAGRKDVVGFAFAINGEVNSVDVYRSSTLFRKLWPKLLRAAATEALAESTAPVTTTTVVTDKDIRASMSEAESAPEQEKRASDDMTIVTRDAEDHILFETRDAAGKGEWMHRSYMKK